MKNINLSKIKKRVYDIYKEKKEKDRLEKEVRGKLIALRKKSLKKEKDDLQENVSLKIEDISQNTINVSGNVVESTKLPYLYVDYNTANIDFAENCGYNTLITSKIGGISDLIIDDSVEEKLENKYIIINLWKVLTKSNLTKLSYNTETVEYKKFINLFENKYKWGVREELPKDLTKVEMNKYKLIYDNVSEFLEQLYKKNKKIFIISNAHLSFIQNILKYYKIDKFIEKIITPSMCGIPYAYNSGTETLQDSRKINIERFFIYIERYIGRFSV